MFSLSAVPEACGELGGFSSDFGHDVRLAIQCPTGIL